MDQASVPAAPAATGNPKPARGGSVAFYAGLLLGLVVAGPAGFFLPRFVPALGEAQGGHAHWLRALKANNKSTRSDAVDGLAKSGAPEPIVVETLTRLVYDDKDSEVRQRAVMHLSQRLETNPDLVYVMIKAIQDTGRLVRMQAAMALGKAVKLVPEVIPTLIEALDDEDAYVTQAAIRALSRHGAAAKEALPILRGQRIREKGLVTIAEEAIALIEAPVKN